MKAETSKKLRTGIVILNYNNYNDTINCIRSILKNCSAHTYQLVVVDNCSSNDSVNQIEIFFNKNIIAADIGNDNKKDQSSVKHTVIRTKKNSGYAKGNNVGIQFLLKQNVDNILILNNDTILTSNIIEPMVACLYNHPEVGLISPLLMNDEKKIDYNCCRNNPSYKMLLHESIRFLRLTATEKFIAQKYLLKTNPDLLNQELINCDIVSGACIMAKASTWKKLDGFDPNTFLYYEENILFEKLKKIGLITAVMPRISAIHLGAKATNKVPNTKILTIELESLLYYLKTYRAFSAIKIKLIQFIRLLQIYLLATNNKLRK